MMRTMLWKEYREHRIVWLAMLAVNCGGLIGLSQMDQMLFSRGGESKLTMLGPMAALLVWGYGMVCGAMLLAGEREEGTLSFLDMLTASRLRIWLVKGQIGLLLLAGQIVVLCGCLAGLRAAEDPTLLGGVESPRSLWPYALGMLVLGLVGLAYALFFSARGENVLHTIGLAIIGQIVAWITAGLLFLAASFLWFVFLSWVLRSENVGPISESPTLILSIFGGLTLATAVGSARIFSRDDRQRRPVAVRRMRGRASIVASWLRVVWLCYRQMSRLALPVLAFSLFLGVLLLLIGPLLWPAATLCLGVLCGVTVFSDEQTIGSFRFLGDQRFPLGGIWIIKTAMRVALLLLASFLILLPFLMVAVYYGMMDRSEPPLIRDLPYLALIAELAPGPSFLLMWPLYGFCAGQLCGLLSRKSIVAAMIAFMISALLVTLWVPSLAGIGLHFWQIAVPPLILLAAAWFLMRKWTADGLASRQTWLGTSAAMAASLLWMAFGIWYRVIEIPDVPDPFNVAEYTASLPAADENKAGQLIRGVWGKVESVMNARHDPRTNKMLCTEWNDVLTEGWPKGESALGEWMDNIFAEDWLQPLASLPDLPLGMVVDPHLLTLRDLNRGDARKWGYAGEFSSLLAARGLQQQARGDPAVFVEHLRIALALSRNFRHHAPLDGIGTFFTGLAVERVWPSALDLWLKKLRGRPDLLQRTLQTLLDHEAQFPDEEESFRAMYLIFRNTLAGAPEQLLDVPLLDASNDKGQHEAELQTAGLLWLFPWEQERHERLLRLAFQRNDPDVRKIPQWGGRTFSVLTFFTSRRARNRSPRELATLRACQLKVALRLYQEENGDLPATLDALVPRYLKSVPHDPFGGQPFHYRRSRGEWIAWPLSNPVGEMPGMADFPGGEVPLMPRADGLAPPPARVLAPGADVAAGVRVVFEEQNPPPEGIPFMPHADEPMRPPLPHRQPGGASPLIDRTTRFVPKGEGILWSVGEDRQDDGGKEQGIDRGDSSVGQDLIYLVPPPP